MSDSWGNYKTEKVALNEVAFNTLEKKVADGSLILPVHFDTMKYFERCGFTVKNVMIRDEKGSMFNIKDADYNNRPNTFVAVRAGNSDGLFNLDYHWYDLDFTVDFK
jgi:DNA modification methylase